ncbi:MAG: HNH endonuclease [Bacteroidia bacterium]|nr:HNH endonuclease [Bacteroidia bacterium]
MEEYPNCPICGRELVPGKSINEHHLVPKSEKGRETVTLHVICHTKIHSVFTEKELADYYYTIERIISHEEMKKFISWVRKQPAELKTRNKTFKGKTRRFRR